MQGKIKERFTQNALFIQPNICLKDKNWFATGGPARFYCQPQTNDEFQQALLFAKDNKLKIFVLGHGANILISDEGFDGLVIRPALQSINHYKKNDHSFVTAGAGVDLNVLINYCLDHHMSGLEEFSGIPGTVGGAVYINIHYFEYLLSQFLIKATIINKQTGIIQQVDNAWFNFGYDHSTLFEKNHFLLDATFKLKNMNNLETAFAKGRYAEIVRHRTNKYPTKNTCGSFFRNFHPDEITLEKNNKKMIWVAYYLDKIGIKGELSVGGAHVSHQHANMIITDDSATSNDIIQLARTMQNLVKVEFDIVSQPECQLIGFKEYPLLQ